MTYMNITYIEVWEQYQTPLEGARRCSLCQRRALRAPFFVGNRADYDIPSSTKTKEEGTRVVVTGTRTFFVNGRLLVGVQLLFGTACTCPLRVNLATQRRHAPR
jgi:hypothetical protein